MIILVWEGATAAIAAVFAVWANWDYLREVAKREAKPRLASWVIWTVAMTVGSVGAARMAQWPAAVARLRRRGHMRSGRGGRLAARG